MFGLISGADKRCVRHSRRSELIRLKHSDAMRSKIAARTKFVAGVFCVVFGVTTAGGDAAAQNLNKKYGPGWGCGSISATPELRALRRACEPCEAAGQDFYRTGPGSGYCVARASSGSSGARSPSSSSPGSAEVGACVPYFTTMRDEMAKLAKVCGDRTFLIASDTDLILGLRPDDNGGIDLTRGSGEAIHILLKAGDPRWRVQGERAAPDCRMPLHVESQAESFLECARVYICGAIAANCGVATARTVATNQCTRISQACLNANPVPTGVAALSPPPDAGRSSVVSEGHKARRSGESGISGPSSRYGNGPVPSRIAK